VPGRQEPFDAIDFTRYRARLRQLHDCLKPRTYLEIGVDAGRSLALADPSTLAVGVDPAFSADLRLGPRTRIVSQSSDEFFTRADVATQFGGTGIELAFIDGLHLFEQALRDVANVARFLAPGGWIALHDTLPYDRVVAQRQRTTQKWTGDVWKVVECLRRERPDLTLVTLDVPPTGLTLVGGLDPRDTTLLDGHERLVSSYVGLPTEGYEHARSRWQVVPDGDRVVPALV
jgi:hypothetical protein